MKKYIISCAVTLLMLSCGSVGIEVSKVYPSRGSHCNLDVYFSENEIKQKYEVIALIDSKTGQTLYNKKTSAAAIENAKPKACSCGADAILLVQSDKVGGNGMSYGYGKATLKCIRYIKQ